MSNNPILVLAGSEEQYRNWLHEQGLTRQDAIFVKSAADYEQLDQFFYVNPGTFWENPAFGRGLVRYFHAHGQLYRKELEAA